MAGNSGGYDYQFVDPGPTDDQKCSICHLVVRDAHQVTCCGKLLCECCLTKCRNGLGKCPMCRGRGDIDNTSFQDTKSDHEIKSLRVYCSYKDAGCEWIGELRGVEEHMKDCNYQTVECPDCKNTMLKLILDKHRSDECLLRKYKCPLCKKEGTYQFITTAGHQNTCPEVELECQITGCNEHVKRCKMSSHTEVCPKQVINCPFNDMGCKVTPPKREDLPAHVKEDITLHMDMMAKNMDTMAKEANMMAKNMDTMAKEANMMAKNMDTMAKEANTMAKEAQFHHRRVVPIVIKYTGFGNGKDNNERWYSEGFYTGIGGYKIRLIVYPNGNGDAKSTHLSVYINLMPGANDDALEFPLRGTFTITILNQLEDKNHYSVSLAFDVNSPEKNSCRQYKLDDANGWGCYKFLPHSSLRFDQVHKTKYLHDGTVYFRVTAEISSKTKPWLAE